MPQSSVPTTEVVTPGGSVSPSLIRTLVPLLVGAVVTSLIDRFAVEIDTTVVAAFVTVVVSWVYYAVVRFLEVYSSPRWSYILGVGKAPVYPKKAEPPTNVMVRDETGSLSLAQASGVVQTVFGVGLLFAGLVVLASCAIA